MCVQNEEKRKRIIAAFTVSGVILIVILFAVVIYQIVDICLVVHFVGHPGNFGKYLAANIIDNGVNSSHQDILPYFLYIS